MKLIAHRGKLSKQDKGNKKQEILKALATSYIDGIECDVRLTKDGEVVVIHDPIIDFVSDGTGIVKYMTLQELKQYRFQDESILTLEELLKSIHTDKMIVIELKGEAQDTDLAEKVHNIISHYPSLHIVIVSFSYPLLVYLKKISPDIEVGLLIGYFLNQDHIYNHFDYNLFSFHYLDQIHMHKKLMYFTINQKNQANELIQKRSDICLITDHASRLRDLHKLAPPSQH